MIVRLITIYIARMNLKIDDVPHCREMNRINLDRAGRRSAREGFSFNHDTL